MNAALLLVDDYEMDCEQDSRRISTPSGRERSSRSQWTTRSRYSRAKKSSGEFSGSHRRRVKRI